MIESFIDSWSLFHYTYLAGWLLAVLLSLLGVWIVARDQIFIGAAIGQSSTLGIALGLWLSAMFSAKGGSLFEKESTLSFLAVVFPIAASLLTARNHKKGEASHESVTGWIFVFSSALAILLVAHSPHGLEEVHRLLSSSIIGATFLDVVLFALLAVITVSCFLFFHRKILLFILDPEMAAAVGVNTRVWSLVSSVWLGLTIGLSLRVSGLLYTFGCLVLPALAAKYRCREVKQMLWVAPLIALVCATLGFFLANFYDYPPAPMTVALLGIFVLITAAMKRL